MKIRSIYSRHVPFRRSRGPWDCRRSCWVRFQALNEAKRGYFFMPLMKGAYDCVVGAIEFEQWIKGRQPLPGSSRPEEAADRPSRSSHSASLARNFQTSASSQSQRLSAPKAPTSDPDAESTLPEQLRSVFRLLTNPIVVCTATHNGVPRAMTMSSFTPLTMSPTPLVSFNIATPSRTLDAIEASAEFNIHILAGDASGAVIADHFTRGNMDGVFDTIGGATYSMRGKGSAPLIRGEGVLRILQCRLLHDGQREGLVRVRDHVIVLGEVVEMIPVTKIKEFGLAYADRRYRQVGGVIENE